MLQQVTGKHALILLDGMITEYEIFWKRVDHFKEVLTLFKKASLTVKLEKCQFGLKVLKYIGFQLMQASVKLDDTKTTAL